MLRFNKFSAFSWPPSLFRKLSFGVVRGNRVSLNDYLSWWRVWRSLPVTSWVKAAAKFRDRDYRAAVDLYGLGLRKYPDHPARFCARLDRAYALFQTGDHEFAKAELEQLCEEKVDLPDAYIILARYYLAGEQSLEALRLLREAVEVFPEHSILLGYYCLIAWNSGFELIDSRELEYSLIAARNKLTERDELWAVITTALATRANRRGLLSDCEEYLTQVISSRQAPVEAYLLKYSLLEGGGQVERAVDQLHRASRVAPDDPRPLIELSKQLSRARDKQTLMHARQLAERAGQLSFHRSPEALLLLASLEKLLGEGELAEILEVHSYMLRSERDLNFLDFDTLQIQLGRLREL